MSVEAKRNVPLLPGYVIDSNLNKDFRRNQTFAVNNGVMLTDVHRVSAPSNALESSLNIGKGKGTYEHGSLEFKRAPVSTVQDEKTLPSWVVNDGKVLRFLGYFTEAVHSSAVENYRVRRCVFNYYLQDDSISVSEPREENSGLPQGVFVKRHRIPAANGSFIKPQDLVIGTEIEVYGRIYRIIDVNDFTRDYFTSQGIQLAQPEEVPSDAFASKKEGVRTDFRKTMNHQKTFMEAAMGKGQIDVAASKQFFKNDGRVLRFYCLWQDPAQYGEKHPYVVHYYLADDTVEVNEIKQANSGRDPFPALLKRSRLPKNFRQTVANVATIGGHADDGKSDYHTAGDFRIGQKVNVFGRELLVCGCDSYTQEYFIETFNARPEDFNQIEMSDPPKQLPRMEAPPYNGFGTEDDSLGSFYNLVPKPPRKDVKKLVQFDGHNLRFLARFTKPGVEDAERRFIITYYMADETVSVFEKVVRNSGFVGGKFLERSSIKNSATGQAFHLDDFAVGVALKINNFDFTIMEADAHTQKYIEDAAAGIAH